MPESQRQLTQAQAIREALDQAMQEDSRVILVGEGVPDPRGIFGTTTGLQQKYGKERVFDSPLSENGMTGICVGAAISGMRPVMVHQRIDFALLAMDQIVNNAAKWRFMFAGQVSVPMVIRVIVGRGWGPGPQHAQSLQALFAHIPGLKVVMPTSAYDAKGMLISAIRDDNPVLFIEHRWLQGLCGHVPEPAYEIALDKCRVCVRGNHVTLVAFSYMVVESLRAAKALAEFGIEVEVIDARSIRPLDIATIVESVNRTGTLVLADTGWKTGGIAGEVVACVAETAFTAMKRAALRIALPDFPAPTSPHLTRDYYPDALYLARAIAGHLGVCLPEADLKRRLTRSTLHDVPQNEFQGPF